MNERTDNRLTLRLTLKRWFKKRTIEIAPARFSWGDESISSERITGIRFGIDSGGANSLLAVRDASGNVITTDWLSGNDFPTVVQSVIGLYAPRILETIVNTINSGESFTMGAAYVKKSGMSISIGDGFNFNGVNISPPSQQISWNWATAQITAGYVRLTGSESPNAFSLCSSAFDPNHITLISCRDVWNAFLLPDLIKIMRPAAQAAEERRKRDDAEREREEMLKLLRGGLTEEEWAKKEQRLEERLKRDLELWAIRQKEGKS